MVSLMDYAVLSALVYRNVRGGDNVNPIPSGWTELVYIPDDGLNGFTAGAYKNGNDIVIAFKGTDTSTILNTSTDWLLGNIPAGIGIGSPQVLHAALFYESIKGVYPNANITFTGHSLGGGLASLMAVFFDKPATTFDEAPFLQSANNLVAHTLQLGLALNGIVDLDLASFLLNPLATQMRASNVNDEYVQGEALSYIRSHLTAIYGADTPIDVDASRLPDSALTNAINLHSIVLLAALKMQDKLRTDTLALPNLLPALFDETLYARPLRGQAQDFLSLLLNNQITKGYDNADGLLARFSNDVYNLAQGGTAGNDTLNKALIAAAVEDYYFMESGFTHDFFQTATGGLSFDLKDIGADWNQKALPRLIAAARELAGNDAGMFLPALQPNKWYVQTGNDALNVSHTGTDNAAMLGGTGADALTGNVGSDILIGNGGADTLTGNAGNDVLVGGGDDDSLTGGKGNDQLQGGAGDDTYQFATGDGNDVIIDSGGQGKIVCGSDTLGGGMKSGLDHWLGTPVNGAQYGYTLVGNGSGGKDLIIDRIDGNDRITVRGWEAGQLGITLSGSDYSVTPQNTVEGDGANNGIAGKDGADSLTGGGGDDLMISGLGRDTLIGGDGADYLFGSESGVIGGIKADYVPPGGAGAVYSRGMAYPDGHPDEESWWVVYDGGYQEDGGGSYHSLKLAGIYEVMVINDDPSLIDGGADNDYIYAGTGSDLAHGGADKDAIVGLAGNDILYGDDGNDSLWGDGIHIPSFAYTVPEDHGMDILDGGIGNDYLEGQGGSDELYGGDGADTLWGDSGTLVDTPLTVHGDDYIDGGADKDTLFGGGGSDEMYGGTGDDMLWGEGDPALIPSAYQGNDYLDGEDGNDYLIGGGKDDELFGGGDDGADTLWGDSDAAGLASADNGNDYLDGEGGSDSLIGGGRDDQLFGGDGNDTLIGDGDDTLVSGADHGNDYLDGEDGDDVLYGDGGDDTLIGDTGNDYLHGDYSMLDAQYHGDDLLDGGDGNDTLDGGGGDDRLLAGAGNDMMAGGEGSDELSGGDDNDQLQGDAGDDILDGGAGDDTLWGGDDSDVVFGGAGSDMMAGGAGVDELSGGDGNDQLQGDAGDDILDGGAGDDVLFGDDGNDVVLGGDGFDQMVGDNGNDAMDGGAGDDALFGGAGDDTLTGGAGTDYLDGGAGNDTYVFYSGDSAPNTSGLVDTVEDSDGGTIVFEDAILSGITAQYGSDENGVGYLTLNFNSGSDRIVVANPEVMSYEFADGTQMDFAELAGHLLQDVLTLSSANGQVTHVLGGYTNDTITSTGGHATLSGGLGNDTITAGGSDNSFHYGIGDGTDHVATEANTSGNVLRLGPGITLADLTLGLGSLALQIGKNSGDTIHFDNFDPANPFSVKPFDAIVFSDGSSITYENLLTTKGFDLSGTSGDDSLSGTALTDRMSGDDGNDTLVGGAGDDVLDGGAGNDSLSGGTGDDWYYVDSAGDAVVENANEGDNDIVWSSVSWTLDPNTEHLGLTGNTPIDGTGNALDNVIAGNSADNVLTGGTGDDVLAGSTGNDTYVFNRGDGADQIIDEINISSDGKSEEYGDAGSDTLRFGAGIGLDDLDLSESGADIFVSLRGSNGDRVQFVNWADPNRRIETIAFADGSSIATTDLIQEGGSGDDSLSGNGYNNLVDGGAGNDTLTGGGGRDTLTGGQGDDVYVFNRGDGNERISDYLVSDAKSGTYGDAGNDTLQFGAGITLDDLDFSMSGSDLVVSLRGTSDQITLANWDDPNRRVENIRFADGTSVIENADLSGAQVIGTDGNDAFSGGAGNDTLDGGLGNDTMAGGAGDDLYQIDATGDVVTEAADGGYDTAVASVSWTLADNVEELYLTGSATIGTGNALDNWMVGNDADNVLNGLAGNDGLFGGVGNDSLDGGVGNDYLDGGDGNDTLTGGAGNDTLAGGAGGDSYLFHVGDGHDVITENDGATSVNDVLDFSTSANSNQLWFQQVGNDLEVDIIGTSDAVTIADWYSESAHHVEQLKSADGKVLNDTQVDQLVQAMAAFAPPAAGQTTLPQEYSDALAPVLAANWH